MGGTPKIIKKIVSIPKRVLGGGGSSSPAPVRQEVSDKFEAPKKTGPEKKEVTRKLTSRRRGRRNRIGEGLIGGRLAGGDTLTAYGPVRNPTDSRTKLGG